MSILTLQNKYFPNCNQNDNNNVDRYFSDQQQSQNCLPLNQQKQSKIFEDNGFQQQQQSTIPNEDIENNNNIIQIDEKQFKQNNNKKITQKQITQVPIKPTTIIQKKNKQQKKNQNSLKSKWLNSRCKILNASLLENKDKRKFKKMFKVQLQYQQNNKKKNATIWFGDNTKPTFLQSRDPDLASKYWQRIKDADLNNPLCGKFYEARLLFNKDAKDLKEAWLNFYSKYCIN